MQLMKYPDDMGDRFGGKFRFIGIAALRCRQLQKGAVPRITSRSKKFTTIAQEEVLAAKVEFADHPIPAPGSAEELLGVTETESEAEA